MASSSDWEWIFILSFFSLVSGLAFVAYSTTFDKNDVPTYFTSNESINGIAGVNASESGSITYLQSMEIKQPPKTPPIFKYVFGTLFGVFVGLLVWRLLRSGSG